MLSHGTRNRVERKPVSPADGLIRPAGLPGSPAPGAAPRDEDDSESRLSSSTGVPGLLPDDEIHNLSRHDHDSDDFLALDQLRHRL
jgi:hypothetical protein